MEKFFKKREGNWSNDWDDGPMDDMDNDPSDSNNLPDWQQ